MVKKLIKQSMVWFSHSFIQIHAISAKCKWLDRQVSPNNEFIWNKNVSSQRNSTKERRRLVRDFVENGGSKFDGCSLSRDVIKTFW